MYARGPTSDLREKRKHAAFVEEIDLKERNLCCVSVARSAEHWPFLVVAQSYSLWEDHAHAGFQSWTQYGDTVILAVELKYAAWTTSGRKLWTTFVEPPWGYEVSGNTIEPNVMGDLGPRSDTR